VPSGVLKSCFQNTLGARTPPPSCIPKSAQPILPFFFSSLLNLTFFFFSAESYLTPWVPSSSTIPKSCTMTIPFFFSFCVFCVSRPWRVPGHNKYDKTLGIINFKFVLRVNSQQSLCEDADAINVVFKRLFTIQEHSAENVKQN
jgi:hypothetical protein